MCMPINPDHSGWRVCMPNVRHESVEKTCSLKVNSIKYKIFPILLKNKVLYLNDTIWNFIRHLYSFTFLHKQHQSYKSGSKTRKKCKFLVFIVSCKQPFSVCNLLNSVLFLIPLLRPKILSSNKIKMHLVQ